MKNATRMMLLSGAALSVMGCTTVATGYPVQAPPPVGYPVPAQNGPAPHYGND